METLFSCSGGADVHRDTVVVTVRKRSERGGRELLETRTFETFCDSLEAMADWIAEQNVEVIGLESTGVYWKPVVRALRRRSPRTLIWLVNPLEVKKVPGRKTDVTDSQWLSKLVMYGLVSPSFLPTDQQEELRTLTRHRTKVVGQQTSCKNRIIKQMEAAGIKLPSVCSDPLGKSARLMLQALLEGESTPSEIADLAIGALRDKKAQLERAVAGSFTGASRFVLRQLLAQLEAAERDVAAIDEQVRRLLEPSAPEMKLLQTVPGIDRTVAATILAEAGGDMSRFESADSLAAWGGVCPGNEASAGDPKKASSRKGDKYLCTILVQAAHGAISTRGSFWRSKYYRLVPRLGPAKAAFAIAHAMLVAVFYILRDGVPYREPTQPPPTPEKVNRMVRQYTSRLQALGFQVTLAPTTVGVVV